MTSASVEETRVPDGVELLTLLEKQDGILSLLVEELDLCKLEISALQSNRQQKLPRSNGNNDETDNTCCGANNSSRQKKECICSQCEETCMMDHSFKDEGKHRNPDDVQENIARKFTALEKTLMELKNCQTKNDSLLRDLESCRCELTLEKESSSLKQAHIERLSQLLNDERERADNEISRLNVEFSEAKCDVDRLKEELLSTTSSLEALKKVESEKSSLLNEYSERLSAEAASRKQETVKLNSRITMLMQENTLLRSSLASVKDYHFNGDVSNLLEDQKSLIATLKEECEMLANRLRKERKEFKSEVRRLRRINKDLTEQVDRFIAGD